MKRQTKTSAKRDEARKLSRAKMLAPLAEAELARSLGFDYFRNAAARTGYGTPSLPEATEYVMERISLNYWLLLTLYRNSWIPARIVDLPAADMTRTWCKLNCQVEPDDIQRFDRVIMRTFTPARVEQTVKWARLFGGAGALICIKGHEKILDEPLDLDDINPGAYLGLIHFDRWAGITPSTGDISSDLTRPLDWGLPEFYEVRSTSTAAATFKVHSSRILRFTGPTVPPPELQAQSYWGISVIERMYEELRKRDNSSWSMLNLLFRANILGQKNPALADLLSGLGSSPVATQNYEARMRAQNELISNQSMVILGQDGELFSTQYSFSGLAELYGQFQMDVAGAAEIPVTRLFGRTITGLSQSNDADERIYEETIAHKQHDELRPQLDKLYPVICMSVLGEVPDDLDMKFPSVRVLTEEEKGDMADKGSAPVIAAYNAGIISQKTALEEFRELSDTTGVFTNVTDEDIENAEDKPQVPGEGMGGEPGEGGEAGQGGPPDPAKFSRSNPRRELRQEAGGAMDERKIKGRLTWHGLGVSIEHPAGSVREGVDPGGKRWRVRLSHDYGYLLRTKGVDGDHVDVFLGPDHSAQFVYVIHTLKAPDFVEYDEDKCFLDFSSEDHAKAAFFSNYDRAEHFGALEKFSVGDFIDIVLATKKKPLPLTAELAQSLKKKSSGLDEFNESDHPRAKSGEKGGQFVKRGQEGSAAATPPAERKEEKPEQKKPEAPKASTAPEKAAPKPTEAPAESEKPATSKGGAASQTTWTPKDGPTQQYYSNEKGEYIKDRLVIHEQAEKAFQHRPASQRPTITILAGGPATGKSHFLADAIKDDPYAALVALDMCRTLLPEFEKMRGQKDAGTLTQDESRDIRDRVLAAALAHNNNIVLEACGSNSLAKQVDGVEKAGYHVKVIYIHRPVDEAIENAIKRAQTSTNPADRGRMPPTDVIENTHARARTALPLLHKPGRDVEVWDLTGVHKGSEQRPTMVYRTTAQGEKEIPDPDRLKQVLHGHEPKIEGIL